VTIVATLARRLTPRRRRDRAPATGRRRRSGDRLIAVLAVLTVLAAGAAGTAWYAQRQAQARDTAVRQALATATPAAKAIFSYDYRNFDASVSNGRAFVTGAFADEYAETTAALRSTAIAEQAVVLAEVSASGVIEAEPDRVELLVYLNQYRRNANTDGEKVDQNRVVLELRRVGAEWKVARATAI
jgi:Mce-associated membrane protein